MTKINLPLLQQVDSGSNNELSFTGDDHTQSKTPKHTGSTEHPAVMDASEAATREGSEKNSILLDSTPEELSPVRQQPRPSRRRRNLGPWNFSANEDTLTSFSKRKTRPLKWLRYRMTNLIPRGQFSPSLQHRTSERNSQRYLQKRPTL